MECIETLTASGRGRWGDHDARFALSTVRRTWRSRRSEQSRSADTFLLGFQLEDFPPDRRWFATANERDTFLEGNITNRLPATGEPSLLAGCRSWVEDFVGDDLAGVWFVMDYLQLQFQRGITNFYAWPQVRSGDSRLDFADPGLPRRAVRLHHSHGHLRRHLP